MARRRSLDHEKKSLAFKLLNGLLPYRERLAVLQPNTSRPACTAQRLSPLSPAHTSTSTALSMVRQERLALLRPLDQTLDTKKALKLDVACNTMYKTMAVLILTTSLLLIYNHRKENKRTSVREVRAERESLHYPAVTQRQMI